MQRLMEEDRWKRINGSRRWRRLLLCWSRDLLARASLGTLALFSVFVHLSYSILITLSSFLECPFRRDAALLLLVLSLLKDASRRLPVSTVPARARSLGTTQCTRELCR